MKYLITIPLETDLDPEYLLEYAMAFADDVKARHHAAIEIEQDEDKTSVESL